MDEETSKQTGKFSIQHGSNILHSLKGNKNKTEKKKNASTAWKEVHTWVAD